MKDGIEDILERQAPGDGEVLAVGLSTYRSPTIYLPPLRGFFAPRWLRRSRYL